MPKIVGIRFKSIGKIYYFDPQEIDLKVGQGAIVETVSGVEFGTVALPVREVEENEVVSPLKPVLRAATEDDSKNAEKNLQKKPNAIRVAKEKILKHDLNMKLIDCEFTFDNTKVIFYFTSDTRVDFRELVKDLAGHFRIRIELRQVGIRDEAKLLGGLGPCGRACCCSTHMGDFARVSIKMAKTQGLSLNPTKISGLCGRLMCCLQHENDHYTETFKMMPKVGSEVETPEGKAFVFACDLLKKIVRVKFVFKEGGMEFKDFPLSDLGFKKKQSQPEKAENAEQEECEDNIIFVETQEVEEKPTKTELTDQTQREDKPQRTERKEGQERKDGQRHSERKDKHHRPERKEGQEKNCSDRPQRQEGQGKPNNRPNRQNRTGKPHRQGGKGRPETHDKSVQKGATTVKNPAEVEKKPE